MAVLNKIKAAVFLCEKSNIWGCVKVTLFQGYGGIKCLKALRGITVSLFIIQLSEPLKKARPLGRVIPAINVK